MVLPAMFPACPAVAHTQTASGKAAHKLEAETEDFHREWLLVRGTAEQEQQQRRGSGRLGSLMMPAAPSLLSFFVG